MFSCDAALMAIIYCKGQMLYIRENRLAGTSIERHWWHFEVPSGGSGLGMPADHFCGKYVGLRGVLVRSDGVHFLSPSYSHSSDVVFGVFLWAILSSELGARSSVLSSGIQNPSCMWLEWVSNPLLMSNFMTSTKISHCLQLVFYWKVNNELLFYIFSLRQQLGVVFCLLVRSV